MDSAPVSAWQGGRGGCLHEEIAMPPPRKDLMQAKSPSSAPVKYDQSRRLKLIALSLTIAILLVWVGFFLVPALVPKNRAKEQQTAGWILAGELNQALANKPAYADTSFSVETENPLKLKLNGMVKTQQDLVRLKEFIKQLKPEAPPEQFEFEVEVRR